jgi:pilus assembly protein CpaC
MLKMLATLVVLFTALLAVPTSSAQAADERSGWLEIELGKSLVVELPDVPRAISVTNPTVADIVQLGSPLRWQVQGKKIGTTDLIIQFSGDRPPMLHEVTVHRDLSDLIRRIDNLVESNPPRVYPLNDRIVLEGTVDDLDTLEQISMIAGIYDANFVNLLRVRGDHQVQLEVIFAEVSRTGLRQMGVNILVNPSGTTSLAGITNGLAADPPLGLPLTLLQYSPSAAAYSLFGGWFRGSFNIFGAINILDQYGLAKVIAQPTLVSLSGQQAEFLSGGEVPVPTPNAQGNITIKYREFGTRMLFVPTVLADDVIDVQINLEMSALDDALAARLNGLPVPGLTSRKVVSHVRLKSGMTFAIAGLLTERIAMTRDEVPGLGRIPVLGALFRSISHEREETELMVYVTPRLVRPMAPGEVPPILGTTENNNPVDVALFLLGATRRAKSRTATPTGDVGLQR